MALSDKTVRSNLDVLTQTYMVRQVQPCFANISKRQVKPPKIYLRDSGILHSLLGIEDSTGLESHPKVGASWEGFALEQVLRLSDAPDAYFWATQSGAELDLLLFRNGRRIGYEFKYLEQPSVTKSMRIAIQELDLDELFIICRGKDRILLEHGLEIVGLESLRGESG